MARESTIGSVFHLEKVPAATTAAITAATASVAPTGNAIPTTEITTALTGAVKGDFVVIEGTGWKELDRKTAHRVSAVGTGTITIDTDTTGETATLATTTAKIRKVETIEVCFGEFGLDTPTPGEIDVTTMCDVERRNVPGLASTGNASFGGPLDLDDTGVRAVLGAYRDGKPRNLIWITRLGQTGIIYGTVSSFSGGPQGVEQAVTYSGSFQVQDTAIYLPPLVP